MNNFIPASYDMLNLYDGTIVPSTIHNLDNVAAAYYRRYLLQRAMSVAKWKMNPNWAENYFLYTLYCWGSIVVFNTPEYGTIFARPGLKGYNIYYQPTGCVVTLPDTTKTYELTFGEDSELLTLTPDYCGILDMVNRYAAKLALCEQTMMANLNTTQFGYVFFAENDAVAKAFRKMFGQISQGEPCVVIDKKLIDSTTGNKNWEMFSQDLSKNYLVTEILEDMRKIENQFATDIGIPNANTEKKERMLVDEVNANNVETISRMEMWMQNWKQDIKKINEHFPDAQLSVDWRIQLTEQKRGEEQNGNIDNRGNAGVQTADDKRNGN